MLKPTKKSKSINFRIVIPVMLITFLQSIVILSILNFGVGKNTLTDSLIDNFKTNVNIRKNYIEVSMYNKWSNLDGSITEIIYNTDSFLNEKGITANELLSNEKYSNEYLKAQAEVIPNTIVQNHVTNSFFILNNNGLENDDKKMLFLRSKNPIRGSNNEIDVLYAPYNVIDYYYRHGYGLGKDVYTSTIKDIKDLKFYENPLKTIINNKSFSNQQCAYWSCDLKIEEDKILTYSIPIIYNGVVIGVFGIGITEQYLRTTIAQLNKGDNLNVSLLRKNELEITGSFNAFMDYSIPDISTIELKKEDYQDIYSFQKDKQKEFYFEEKLNLYNEANIYSDEWYVVGILPRDTVLKTRITAYKQVGIIYFAGFIVTVLAILYITNVISRPIKKVAHNINEKTISNIPMTNIKEVDMLLSKMSYYFEKSLQLNQKLNRLIEDSNTNLAIAEFSIEENLVTTTSKFYSMLNMAYDEKPISSEEFIDRIIAIKDNILSSTLPINKINETLLTMSGEYALLLDDRYLRLKIVTSNDGAFATLIDLTAEYQEKRKIEYERDYDILTGLLNRRGLLSIINSSIANNPNSAIFMIDIDHLKQINDELGHEVGDNYIKVVGNYLFKLSKKYKGLYPSHISGDEYILYLEDAKMVNEVAKDIENMKNAYLNLHSKKVYISLSCGVAINDGSLSYDELRRRADFTMYTVKKTYKNKVAFFDNEAYDLYQKENTLREKLDQLITTNTLDFAYQPIVDIKSGEILGYEALMRPQIEELKLPNKVLELAKKYNKLYEIEYLTLFNATEKFIKSNNKKLLFINSIASQMLVEEDVKVFDGKYHQIFDRIVFEIIEEDFGGDEVFERKTSTMKSKNLNFAIDDYGTGFNNIGMILDYNPKYIKIDGSLIHNINNDAKKKQFAKSIILFCKENNILVIAESVETYEELKCIKELGADYVQGYFIAKPNFEIIDLEKSIKELIKKA